jgi:hypothetical protein
MILHAIPGNGRTCLPEPQQFLQYQDSGYVAMDDSPHNVTPIQPELAMAPPSAIQQQAHFAVPGSLTLPGMRLGEKYLALYQISHVPLNIDTRFQYHTTLNAPTAMLKYVDEIPVTYLNKGQPYTISILDKAPPMPQQPGTVKYRTFVRVSFEDEQQRARPDAFWKLWNEGRGTNEAHQRGGKLLAVEYVDPNQGGDDVIQKSKLSLRRHYSMALLSPGTLT